MEGGGGGVWRGQDAVHESATRQNCRLSTFAMQAPALSSPAAATHHYHAVTRHLHVLILPQAGGGNSHLDVQHSPERSKFKAALKDFKSSFGAHDQYGANQQYGKHRPRAGWKPIRRCRLLIHPTTWQIKRLCQAFA